MSDNFFYAVLSFSLLAAGTAALGSELVSSGQRPPVAVAARVVTLPPVIVIGHRSAPAQVVMLPAVTVTGHRSTSTVA